MKMTEERKTPERDPATGKLIPREDPIVTTSLSWHYFFFTGFLLLAVGYAMLDEIWLRRPWKAYQTDFLTLYEDHLDNVLETLRKREEEVRNSPEFLRLEDEIKKHEESVAPDIAVVNKDIRLVNGQLDVLRDTLKVIRSEIAANTYKLETADDDKKAFFRTLVSQLKDRPQSFEYPDGIVDGKFSAVTLNLKFEELTQMFRDVKSRRDALVKQQTALLGPANAARARKTAYLNEKMDGLTAEQVAKIRDNLNAFEFIRPRQVFVKDVGLVDRCQSCHLGIGEPVPITLEDMHGRKEFISHPKRLEEILKIHPPETDAGFSYGCSPCHNGNGAALSSVFLAHGRNKHWLYSLFDKENIEAGCQQCHEGSLVLKGAPTLNHGRELFRKKGCWGCHKRAGFDPERAQILKADLKRLELENRRAAIEKEKANANRIMDDRDSTDEQIEAALKVLNETAPLSLSGLETEAQQLGLRMKSLIMQRKKAGPNLKEIKAKLNPDWIPIWLKNPHDFRPGTKMPQFRLNERQIQTISAFIWQRAIDAAIPEQPMGDAARGRERFERRGCLACHSMGEATEKIGNDFAANLERVGEKMNYDYLVRWIHNPRQRLRPYSPALGRDLEPKDYTDRGKPFVFDAQHSLCPITGQELVTQNMTVMPSLRLSWEESRDIAAYLMTKRRAEAHYPRAAWLEDEALAEEGGKWIKHFGCAGCHEIAGLEQEGGIGTELTAEGSKPLERLDFGLLTHEAKHPKDSSVKPWYDHKGFFMRKLQDPAIFDQGKIKEEDEKLRMPDFHLKDEERVALTTFLLGSVDSRFPDRFYYHPTGPARDIEEGWWIIKKYNCTGCHQIEQGRKPAIQDLPWFREIEKAPPTLVGEGARVHGTWLARFLRNPSLSTKHTDRNGVRPYLQVRMPTFFLSDMEIEKIVKFFNALAEQPTAYVPEDIAPLSPKEHMLAREAFALQDCLKCHVSPSVRQITEDIIAPNLVLAKDRLKSRWMQRWVVDPASFMPGTKMPGGLFRKDEQSGRWLIGGSIPDHIRAYDGDHVALFIRLLHRFTREDDAVIRELASLKAKLDQLDEEDDAAAYRLIKGKMNQLKRKGLENR